jgi:hypothetical protein
VRVALCGLGLAAALAAGCGGGEKATAPPTSTTTARQPRDPGLDAVTRMIRATRTRDRAALWALLSEPARRRLGPTLADFRKGSAPKLERALRPFRKTGFHVDVSERITGRFGVVGISSGSHVYAAPLRLELGSWKLDLGRSPPLAIRVLGPDVGSVSRVQQIAFEVRGAPGGATAILYVDGVNLRSREAVARGTATVYSNLESPLTPGPHSAVAFATRGDSAVAKAWTFVAR